MEFLQIERKRILIFANSNRRYKRIVKILERNKSVITEIQDGLKPDHKNNKRKDNKKNIKSSNCDKNNIIKI